MFSFNNSNTQLTSTNSEIHRLDDHATSNPYAQTNTTYTSYLYYCKMWYQTEYEYRIHTFCQTQTIYVKNIRTTPGGNISLCFCHASSTNLSINQFSNSSNHLCKYTQFPFTELGGVPCYHKTPMELCSLVFIFEGGKKSLGLNKMGPSQKLL